MSWLNDIKEGKRFRFGNNWKDFVENNLNEDSVKQAISCTKNRL